MEGCETACIKDSDIAELKADIKITDSKTDSNSSDIKIMNSKIEGHARLIDRLKDKSENIGELATAISVMSVSLEHIVKHNDKQDRMQERLSESLERQSETMIQVNQNLNELNEGWKRTNDEVASLKRKVHENEQKSYVDLRDLERERQEGILRKYGVPLGIATGFGVIVLEVIRIAVSLK